MATSSITALGAGSGVDTVSLAQGLVDAEKIPTQALINKKIATSQANISGYAAVQFVVDSLKTAFADLKNVSSFNNLLTVNSEPSAFTADPSSTATVGYQEIEITTLASAQRNVSGSFSSGDTVLNAGNPFKLSLSVHGKYSRTISVTEPSPAGVVSAINSSLSGVTAQLINTGNVNAPYKITLKGSDGQLNDFTLEAYNETAKVTAVTTEGTASTTESVALTFVSDLSAGETISIAGLTYTAGSGGTTKEDVAQVFAGLENGATSSAYLAGGAVTGRLSGFTMGSLASDGVSLTALSKSTSAIEMTDPAAAFTTVSLGGLEYTPLTDASPADLAAAFANIDRGTQPSNPVDSSNNFTGAGVYGHPETDGTLSTTLMTGFSTGAALGTSVMAYTQTDKIGDVPNLEIKGGPLLNSDGLGGTFPNLDFSTILKTATNANITVNGLSISSDTNVIEDAIPGVTLTLNSTTAGVAHVNFIRDTTEIVSKIDALVTAYNDANAMLGVVSDPKSTVDTYGATLVGNSLIRQITNDLRNMVTSTSSTPSDGMTALRDIGVIVSGTGDLTVDAAKRDSALRFHYSGVTSMFTGDQENLSTLSPTHAGIAGDSVKKLTNMLASTGAIANQNRNAETNITNYEAELAKLEIRMTALLSRYTKQFAIMDSMVGQSNRTREGLKSTFEGMMAAYTNA